MHKDWSKITFRFSRFLTKPRPPWTWLKLWWIIFWPWKSSEFDSRIHSRNIKYPGNETSGAATPSVERYSRRYSQYSKYSGTDAHCFKSVPFQAAGIPACSWFIEHCKNGLNLKNIVCYQTKTIIWFELWCQIWNWTVRKIHLKETLSSRNPYIPDMKIKLYSNHFSNSFMPSFSLAEKVQYFFWLAEIKKSISESI